MGCLTSFFVVLLRHFFTTEKRPLVPEQRSRIKTHRLVQLLETSPPVEPLLPSDLTDLSEGGVEVLLPLDPCSIAARV